MHLNKIKRFGCIAYTRIPITDTKFSPRAIKPVLVRFSSSGYILWYPSTRKFLCSKHVKFNEKLWIQISNNSEISADNDLETISFENHDSETVESGEVEKETDESQTNTPKGGRPRKISTEDKYTDKSLAEICKPKRKAKEGRDFTTHAKTVELENLIKDINFAYFTAIDINKRTIIFRDAYSEVPPSDNLEE